MPALVSKAAGQFSVARARLEVFSASAFNQPWAFGVSPEGVQRTYVLVAASGEERDAWVQFLVANGAQAPQERGVEERAGGEAVEAGAGAVAGGAVLPVYDLSQSIKEGYLLKRGDVFKTWKIRYFVMLPRTLLYYSERSENQASQVPKGSITLVSAAVEREPPSEYEKTHCFSVTPIDEERTYILVAADEADRESWLAALRKQVEVLETGGVVSAEKKRSSADESTISKLKEKQGRDDDGADAASPSAGVEAPEIDDAQLADITAGNSSPDSATAAASFKDEDEDEDALASRGPTGAMRDRRQSVLDLRSRLLSALGGNQRSFDKFRQASAQYIQGELSSIDYLRLFFRLFPTRKALSIFPDLLQAVPDPARRQELRVLFARIQEQLSKRQG